MINFLRNFFNKRPHTPPHLGGHLNITNVDESLLIEAIDTFKIKSMLDIGCGPGGMQEIAKKHKIIWYGIDGDPSIIKNTRNTILHDFTKGKCTFNKSIDLAWCTEFLEHVEEKYIDNFMPLFKLAKISIVTAAPPGWPGHHHVNCRKKEYWIKIFKSYGLFYDEKMTIAFKSKSKMRKNFFERAGLVFVNKNYSNLV